MNDLNWGIVLPNWEVQGDTERLVEYGVAAEEAGWDGVFLADHLAMGGDDGHPDFPDPWITLSGIAARTDEITLGSWVTPIPRRQPWQLARDLATLDRLSGGRVMLGTGLGRAFDYTTFGDVWEPRRLGAKYDEALAVITGLWTGEPFSFDGEFFTVDEAVMRPTPVQEPRIPIVVGGVWPNKKPFHRGSEWDGMMPHYRGDGILPVEGYDRDQTGDLDIPERPGDVKTEVSDMLEYYTGLTEEPGELFLPADQPHASDDWAEFCSDLGATWLYERNLAPESGWSLTMERVRKGPPI
ncbi:MAG: LLM class flavin-dependent oxidoreductase [Haloarculaceae archaeon]